MRMSVRSIETSRLVESSPMVPSVSAETDDVAFALWGSGRSRVCVLHVACPFVCKDMMSSVNVVVNDAYI
ncbi:hypothetical protein BPORC_1827 [Bifidobacterium porcinum]|nr:hypothetical protein BPORC_1827 [Bifidobacterium porcinum]